MADKFSTEDKIKLTDVNVNKNGLDIKGTAFSSPLDKQKYAIQSARLTQQELEKIISLNSGSPWPQIKPDSTVGGKMGFLPSVLLQPTLQTGPVKGQTNEGRGSGGEVVTKQTYANYKFQDWRGQMIDYVSTGAVGTPWPQNSTHPEAEAIAGVIGTKTKGFFPPKMLSKSAQLNPNVLLSNFTSEIIQSTTTKNGERVVWPQNSTHPESEAIEGVIGTKTKGFFPPQMLKKGNIVSSPTASVVWPQTTNNPGFSETKGYLPPQLMDPVRDSEGIAKFNLKTQAQYKIDDWSGQKLQNGPDWPTKSLSTEDRFQAGKDLPRENPVLLNKPHSRRDIDLIFGDGRSDYFKNSLQVIGDGKAVSNLTPIENPPTGASTLRLDRFKETPWENQDPPMFGFDIIFDSYSSPLLNGSLSDFILNYSNVSEILSKRQVYEEFKNQFQKFFRINGEMKVDPTQIAMTSLYSNVAAADSSSPLFNPHKKNYLGHYLKKISGLDFLIEQNKGDTIKYTPDYKKDFITLDFREDVSMNLGTLAHLYKTLYWSKPNGKMLIPENLLRFNCIIIVSECRNFQRVKKGIKNPENINIIKDNLSRYVYTLRECQFYFDKMPLPNEIDMGDAGPQMFENYSLNFDFKYSSVKLERFVPNGDWGNYVGIDGGSIWKVGNKGTRNSRGQTGSQELSTPKFFTVGPDNENYTYYPNLKINGEEKPYIMAVYGPKSDQADEFKKSTPAPTEGTLGSKNEGTGGQNLAETGAGNDGKVEQGTTTTTGGGAIPGGGTIPNGGAGSGATIDNLKKQSEQASSEAQQQNENQNVQEALDNLKSKSSVGASQIKSMTQDLNVGSMLGNLKMNSNIAASSFKKITSDLNVGDVLSGLKAKSSIGSNLIKKATETSSIQSVIS